MTNADCKDENHARTNSEDMAPANDKLRGVRLKNRHNVSLRLVLDNRTNIRSKSKGGDSPKYPVAMGVRWDNGGREKVCSIRSFLEVFCDAQVFRFEREVYKNELAQFDVLFDKFIRVIDSMEVWDYNEFKGLLETEGYKHELDSVTLAHMKAERKHEKQKLSKLEARVKFIEQLLDIRNDEA